MKILGIAGNKGAGKDTIASILVRTEQFVAIAFADELKRLCGRIFEISDEHMFGESSLREKPYLLSPGRARKRFMDQEDEISKLFIACQSKPSSQYRSAVFMAVIEQLSDMETRGDCRVRHVLQLMGTEWGRRLWPKIWTTQVSRNITALRDPGMEYHRSCGLIDHRGRRDRHGNTPTRAIPGVVITDSRFPNEAAEIHAWGGKMIWVDASGRIGANTDTHASEPKRSDFVVSGVDLIDCTIVNNQTLEILEGDAVTAHRGLFT